MFILEWKGDNPAPDGWLSSLAAPSTRVTVQSFALAGRCGLALNSMRAGSEDCFECDQSAYCFPKYLLNPT
jgi:hypothetical protein